MPPRVSVVVPARDAAATLPAALDALAAQDLPRPAFEVIVVDDGSVDATAAIARAHPVGAVVVALRPAGGPGAARNAGIAAGGAPVVAFTDADCTPTAGWLRAGLAALEAGADVVQGAVVPAGPVGPFDRTVAVGRPTGLFETASLLVRRSWLEHVGGFAPWLPAGRVKELGEDAWLGWRLVRAGAVPAFAPEAAVGHAVHPRGPGGLVAEQLRLRHFPALVGRIGELRGAALHRGLFLGRRRTTLVLAMGGAALARRRPAAALLALPHARRLVAEARPHGRRRLASVLATRLAADLVGEAALLAGSLRARTLVL